MHSSLSLLSSIIPFRFCSRKNDRCQVDSVSRTNCKKCRLRKCLDIGMRPEKVDRVRKKRQMKVEVKAEDEGREAEESCLSSSVENSSPVTTEMYSMDRLSLEPLEPTPRQGGRWGIPAGAAGVDVARLAGAAGVDVARLAEETIAQEPRPWVPATVNTIVQSRSPVIVQNIDPQFELTFEEDFKIHELLVRKDNVLDSYFNLMFELPSVHDMFVNFLKLCNQPEQPVVCGMNIDDVKRFNKFISGNVASGGIVRQSLEMYDEYKQVDDHAKTETFMFTIEVMALCTR